MFYGKIEDLEIKEEQPKKRQLKTSTLYLLLILLFIIFIYILDLFNIIYIYNNSILINNIEVIKYIVISLILKGIKTIVKKINDRQ